VTTFHQAPTNDASGSQGPQDFPIYMSHHPAPAGGCFELPSGGPWFSDHCIAEESLLPGVGVKPVKKPIQWLVSDRCGTCGSKDSHSWSWIGGVFYCQRCWPDGLHGQSHHQRRQQQSSFEDAILIPAFDQLHILKPMGIERHHPGGPAQRFYDECDYISPHPLFDVLPKILVVDADLLEVAERSGHGPVLVCAGEDAGPLCRHAQGSQQELVNRASTLQMALVATWQDTELPTPAEEDIGGFYVPNVLVHSCSDGRRIKPFRIAMVYAAPLTPPTTCSIWATPETTRYLKSMRAKIRNVLRKCSLEEHNEIVLGAWGCDGRRLVEKMQIADMFHEALLGSNDADPVAHSF
jgi:hypothetical protein